MLRFAMLLWLALAAGASAAQSFPVTGKPLRIVVPFPPGGQTDIQARAMAPRLSAMLGVPVVVDNKPGGATIIGVQDVMRAQPDGHTILYTITATVALNPHLFAKLPYEPGKHLTPIMFAGRSSTVLVTQANAPFGSVKELVAYAKANPGKLNFGSFSPGSTGHLNGELLKQNAGIDIVHVPFKGSAEAMAALLGGHIHLMFDGPITAIANAKAGKTRMLAYADAARLGALPDLPTMTEAGVPGVDIGAGMVFYGPAGMTREVVGRVNAELAAVLRQPEITKLYVEGGTEVAASSPEELARIVGDMSERWGAIVRKLGIRLD